MKIWLVNPYDTIPGELWRPGRYSSIATMLAEHGHQVMWWNASFSHYTNRIRSPGWAEISVSENLKVKLVPTPAYYSHTGLARLRFLGAFAWGLYRWALREQAPASIIAVSPMPAADYAIVKIAEHFHSRLIIDVMDLWPELFTMLFPRSLRPLAPVALYPFYALRRYGLRRAEAVTAVCQTYLDLAQRQSPHLKTVPSKVIYNGVDLANLRALLESEPDASHQIRKPAEETWAIYAGTLGNNYDIETLLQTALLLEQLGLAIRIVVAGDGPLRQKVINFIKNHRLTHLDYVGMLDLSELVAYYRVCDIGLSPYAQNSTVVFPYKVFDYFAAGLPVVNSLPGELERFLREREIGIQYAAGDAPSLVEALRDLATQTDKRRKMSQNAYRIAPIFDRQTQYLQFLDLIGPEV